MKDFYEEAEKRAKRALDFSLETIINQIDTRGEGWPLIVFNSLPWQRTEPVIASLIFPWPLQSIRILDTSNNEVPWQIVGMKEEKGQWKVDLLFIARSELPRIDVRIFMDWQERNIMVKATFPLALENPVATFEIPFGAINREPIGNEVPALKWIDLSEKSGHYKVSLLNDSRYGCDVKNNIMRLSLIRGATYPDPEADRGQHELAYSLYPHSGTWKEALSFRRALEFNNLLRTKQAMIQPGKLGSTYSFLRIFPENIILTAFKKQAGYGRRGLILRLYEIAGQETESIIELPKEMEIWEADLIERPQIKLNLQDF